MLIEVKNLEKTYKNGTLEFQALKGIDLSIDKGEFVAIMGTSGSGKSTFMNILGCLDKPSVGEYILDGTPVQDMSEDELSHIRNKKIGFVFQSFNLIPRTSALRNVELPLLYARKSPKERKAKATELLTKVGLGDKLENHPNEVSGGQRQRIAIARALANDPPIIFADEPTGNLDSRSGEEVMDIFKSLHKDGVTIVLVTHEREIAEHAHRVVTFKDGEIINDEQLIKD